MTFGLWIVQILLALLFLYTGGMKLVLPRVGRCYHAGPDLAGGGAPLGVHRLRSLCASKRPTASMISSPAALLRKERIQISGHSDLILKAFYLLLLFWR